MQDLKDFVAYGRLNRKTSDELVEMIVADWPNDDVKNIRREIAIRLKRRMTKKYGSVLATILFYVVAEYVIRAVLDWWLSSRRNQVTMKVWHNAETAKGV
jgi:hypothetical protein